MEEEKVKDIQPEILENRRVKEMPEVVELIEIGMVVWEVNPIMMKDVESEEETEKSGGYGGGGCGSEGTGGDGTVLIRGKRYVTI